MKSEARGLKITKIMSRNYNCIAYIMKPTSEKNAVLVWSHVMNQLLFLHIRQQTAWIILSVSLGQKFFNHERLSQITVVYDNARFAKMMEISADEGSEIRESSRNNICYVQCDVLDTFLIVLEIQKNNEPTLFIIFRSMEPICLKILKLPLLIDATQNKSRTLPGLF